MKRHKHSLSNYKLATFSMGRLVPVGMYEVLPGDTIQHSTSIMLRVAPQLAPVMHPMNVRIHHWFVPYRILWSGWEDFITGVSETPPPQLVGVGTKSDILDYMGVPPGHNLDVLGFPAYAYNMIWNEFYRDQDLQTERAANDLTVAQVAWDKDYFTTARPWPQKGPEVTLPLGTSAPVQKDPRSGFDYPTFLAANGGDARLTYEAGDARWQSPVAPTDGAVTWGSSGLVADLSAATAVNVNEVRRAFALQRYQEARALYGSRYTEYLAYLGVKSSDARLQRPEYLGGGKTTISFSEVLKTGAQVAPEDDPIGALKGHGIAAMRSRRFRKFFEEHGVVLSLATVRPKSIYSDGLHRSWIRYTKEDYWQKELEMIGQQEIYNREVYAGFAPGTWGYGDRYSEYRSVPSTVSSDFRDTLNFWHLARQFASGPPLNADFIECDPGMRIFAEQTGHPLWAMIGHRIQARRMVGNNSVGRII